MKYYYDVILNFFDRYLPFYEWSKDDNFDYISKIPIFKIKTDDIYNLINYDVLVDQNFLSIIKDKTILKDGLVNTIEYACIFTDSYSLISLEFFSNGKTKARSYTTLDDDLNICRYSKKMSFYDLEYKKLNKVLYDNELRQLKEKKNNILILLNESYSNKEYDKLRYFYMKIFDEYQDDVDYIYKRIINKINTIDNNMLLNLSNELIFE